MDDRLNEREMVQLCIAILIAGYEATSSQIPNFIYTLLTHQSSSRASSRILASWRRRSRSCSVSCRSRPPRCFRTTPPRTSRWATPLVRAGEPVFASVGAANHDPRKFSRSTPARLRSGRAGALRLAVGCICIGASLARVELQEALKRS